MVKEEINVEKQKLVRYLYPTKQIRELMCNDIYQELLEVIPMENCISEDNVDDRTRENNLSEVRGVIKGFVLGNSVYKQILFDYYKIDNLEWIVGDILIGFVLYISTLSEGFENIDILSDKRSILYGEQVILDLLG